MDSGPLLVLLKFSVRTAAQNDGGYLELGLIYVFPKYSQKTVCICYLTAIHSYGHLQIILQSDPVGDIDTPKWRQQLTKIVCLFLVLCTISEILNFTLSILSKIKSTTMFVKHPWLFPRSNTYNSFHFISI